jgi:hypothetical protein
LQHQAVKVSTLFQGFEGGIGPPTHGGPHSSTWAPISNHQTSIFSIFFQRAKLFGGCFELGALKVELAPNVQGTS